MFGLLSSAVSGDHPRVCGEKSVRSFSVWSLAGSPPRMRGKVCLVLVQAFELGITPAYAGKSQNGDRYMIYLTGSPPRMRGKERQTACFCVRQGITPAYAGKSSGRLCSGAASADHPRVCGEKFTVQTSSLSELGSPPRMRGKVHSIMISGTLYGITPAYAGKRLKRSRSTVPPVAIVPLFPSVCNKPVVSDGSPAGRDAPLFLPAENAVPASPAYNLRFL